MIQYDLSINLTQEIICMWVMTMLEEIWKSVEEVHNHGKLAVSKTIRELVKDETLQKYYKSRNNKGWVGNSVESDWFYIPNNSRKEADIPHLNLDIKVTPIKYTRNGWSAKERLTLNLFNFFDEHTRKFENASFLQKAPLIELLYYEYKKEVDSPDYVIKAANLLDIKNLPQEDLLIMEQDWNLIVQKIKEGKAEELSDSLTKHLGATTKGAKTESNQVEQPFSDNQAHKRAFTLKSAYMTSLAKKFMNEIDNNEKLINSSHDLKRYTFEEIILRKFDPYIGKSKKELASIFNIKIPQNNDKASSSMLARKMLNLDGEIEGTEEFKKAGITAKILTIIPENKKAKEHFKILIPGESSIEPSLILNQTWKYSSLREYLTTQQFLLVIYEKIGKDVFFKGVKFWRVNNEDLEGMIRDTWLKVKSIISKGVTLKYVKRNKPTKTGKLYEVHNNLPGIQSKSALHVRPSATTACYYNNPRLTMELPTPSKWINKPISTDWVEGSKPLNLPSEELTSNYMTKQAWWLNSDYMYSQVKEFFD